MAGDRIAAIAGIIMLGLVGLGAPAAGAPRAAKSFASPDDAVAALVAALQAHDPRKIADILGPGSEKLVRSGDPVKDRAESDRFLRAYAEHHALTPEGDGAMILHVGTDDWPLPIPLLQQDGAWRFNAKVGAQMIVDRRIGRNETQTIRFCLAYVDAQKAYFDLFKEATGSGAFAQHLVSTPGNYDGLYWPPADGIPESPLTPLVQSAVEEGYPGEIEAGHPIPYQGYYFRVLTAQGDDAPGGAKSYLQDGKLADGFALIAWPAIHGASGVMTFIVNQDGTVFQRDLGPETAKRVAAIQTYNPSLDWARVDIDR